VACKGNYLGQNRFSRPAGGQEPLAVRAQLPLGIDAPVIDVAVAALARPDYPRLLFPRDGHLNASGHAFVAATALPPLRAALFPASNAALLGPGPAPGGAGE
jgi:hypothetical protein